MVSTKQNNVVPYQNRRGSLERAYDTFISRDAPAVKHKFDSIRLPGAPPGRDLKLLSNVYKPTYTKAPNIFREITSTNPKTPWPSHKAEHWSCPYVDSVLKDHAKVQNEMALLGNAWIGACLKPTCNLVIRSTHIAEIKWLLPDGHLYNGAVVCWPLRVRPVPNSDRLFFIHQRNVCYRGVYQAVLDHTKWIAYRVEWLSPYSQVYKFGGAGMNMGGSMPGFGVYPFTIGTPQPLLAALCRDVFL